MLDISSTDLIRVSSVRFPAGETHLSGTLFLPVSRPRAAVVLNGATGVPQSFYRHFARWLAAERGIACLTYDYAGMGASATGHMRDCDATMARWIMIDQPAARAEIRRQLPNVPIWVLGHSLGALALPMQKGIEDITRVIAVCSGYVHHSDHPWPYQGLARVFWFGHAPLATWAMGYLPGKRLGFGADIPAGAYWQWRRWCTTHGFFDADPRSGLPAPDWSRSNAPVRLVALEDDVMIPPDCVWRMERSYGAQNCTRARLNPREFGLGPVGHMGAFAQANARLWPALLGEDTL